MKYISKFIAFFAGAKAADFAWKSAIFGTFIAMFFVIVAAFVGFVITAVSSFSSVIPEVVTQVWNWFLPPNAVAILISILTVRIARNIYDIKVALLTKHLRTFANN